MTVGVNVEVDDTDAVNDGVTENVGVTVAVAEDDAVMEAVAV